MDHEEASRIKMKQAFVKILFFAGSNLYLFGQVPNDVDILAPAGVPAAGQLEENASAPKQVRSSQAETVRKAGEDVRFGEEGARVGAAKLLGKYPGSLSATMLVGALDDQSPLVRRASMVSLSEHANNGYPLYDKTLVEKVFSKLGDPDVEVRREVTTLIPRIVSGLMRGGMEVVEINGRKVYRSVPSNLRPDLYQLAIRAFSDEDAIVRQNILKYHQYIRVSLPASTLVNLLGDPDQRVQLEALGRVYSNASQRAVVDKIDELSKHADKGIRLKVVDVARDSNRYHPAYRGILRSMTKDEDPEVTSMAAVELARFGERIAGDVIERIKQYLLAARGMSSQVTTILYAVSAMGKDGAQVYRALTEHSSSKMRSIAWQRYLSLSSGWQNPELWLPGMRDRDKGVRDAILMSLRGRVKSLKMEQLGKLVGSQYPDVRIFAGQSLMTADQEAFDQFGFDLLIDEDTVVRSTTLRAMGQRRVAGWVRIMSRSLLDDDYVIQRAAMDALLTDRQEGVKALSEYVAKNPQARISALARVELERLGVR